MVDVFFYKEDRVKPLTESQKKVLLAIAPKQKLTNAEFGKLVGVSKGLGRTLDALRTRGLLNDDLKEIRDGANRKAVVRTHKLTAEGAKVRRTLLADSVVKS